MEAESRRLMIAACVTAVCLVGSSGVAFAATIEPEVTSADEAAKVVAEHEGSIAGTSSEIELTISGEGWSSSQDSVAIVIPGDASEGISVESAQGSIGIDLPAADSAERAEHTDSGLLVYDNNDGSYTVPIAGDAGDLQLNTVIGSADAPTEFAYKLDLPSDARLEQIGQTLSFFNAGGELLLFVTPPWAKDADGVDVPTRYEFTGDTLTQVVEHSPEFEYPVVADPYFGLTLFHEFKGGTWKGQKTYNAWPTPAARIAYAGIYTTWVAVMSTAGWSEWKKAWPKITDKRSVYEQFVCHVAAGPYGVFFTQDYNLERWRPNRTNGNWMDGVASHLCNWKYATGGTKL